MKKLNHVFSVILAVVMLATVVPMSTVVSAKTNGIDNLFGSSLSAPKISFVEMDETNTDSVIWYEDSADLQPFFKAYDEYSDDIDKIFESYPEIEVYNQTDIKFDNSNWQYTPEWDTDAYVADTDAHKQLSCWNVDKIKSGIMAYFWSQEAYDAYEPYLNVVTDEYGDTYFADLNNHTMYVRMRSVVKYYDVNNDKDVFIISPWSSSVSVGKNGTQKSLELPTELSAPELSDLKYVDGDSEGSSWTAFFEVPKNVFEADMFFEIYGGSMYFDVEYRVNGGEWTETYVGNGDVVRGGTIGFSVDGTPSDDIEVRVRFHSGETDENEEYYIYSTPWSNVLWNNDTCKDGHTLEYVKRVEPKCDKDGNIEYWHCTVCQKNFADSSAKNKIEKEEDLLIKALEHSYTIELENTSVPPTCQEVGYENQLKCTKCGNVINGNEIEKIPHSFDNTLESHNATCEEGAYEIKHCSLCKQNIRVDTTLSLGHDWDYENTVVIEKATCTTSGKVRIVCKRDNSHTYTTVYSSSGHDWDNGKLKTPASCTSPGIMEYTCKVDSTHKKAEIIPKLQHDFSDITSPTCKHCTEKNPKYSQKAAENAVIKQYKVDPSTVAINDSKIKSTKSDNDFKGSTFGKLQLRQKKTAKTTITIQWTKCTGADGYILYGNKCGKNNQYKKLSTFSKSKTTYTNKKLKKGTYYKYMILAYKNVNGKKVTIAASKTVHITTTGGKKGNSKAVSVTKFKTSKSASKVTIKKKKSVQIKAKEVKKDKPINKHIGLRYESSKTSVATVNSKGKITGKKAGKCTVYVYAQNGLFKKITVTVK